MLAKLREVGRVRVFPHAAHEASILIALGFARWDGAAVTLKGGTYGWWLESTEERWTRGVCKCCGAPVLISPDGSRIEAVSTMTLGEAS